MGNNNLLPSGKEISSSSRWFVLLFIVLSLGIIAGSALYYREYEKNFRARVAQQLSAIAEMKVNDLMQWRKERMSDAFIFYRNSSFLGLVKRSFNTPRDGDARKQLQQWIGKLAATGHYDRVFLLDTACKERMCLPDEHELPAVYLKKDLFDVFHSGKITFLDFHRNAPEGPIHLALQVPIFDENEDNRPLAVLVLRIDPNVYLYPFIQSWPVPSKTSETLIARREGNEAVFLNELKFRKNTALRLHIPLQITTAPVVEAVLGRQGIMEGIDYRGTRVLAATRTVPDSPWFLVARMDITEAYGPMRDRFWQMALFICIILAGMGTCLVLLLRQQRMRNYREQLKAAEELRKSEENFRTIFENNSSALAIINRDTTIAMVNKEYCKLGLYEKNDVVGTSWTRQIPPEDLERLKEYNRKRLVDPASAPDHYEFSFYRKDGVVCDCLMSIASLPTSGKIICSFIDITERKRAMETLRESESRFRQLAESLPQLVWTCQPEGPCDFLSQKWVDYTGIPEASQMGFGWLEQLHPDDRAPAVAAWEAAVSLGTDFHSEFRIRRHDGEYRWFDTQALRLRNSSGQTVKWFGSNTDITERKRTEEALRTSEARYRSYVDVTGQIGWVTNADGEIVEDVPSLRKFSGQTYEEAKGSGWAKTLHPDDLENVLWVWKNAVSTKSPYETEYRMRRHDGVYRDLLARGYPVFRKDGSIQEWVGTCIDITERKQAEETLRMNEARFRTLVENIPQKIFMKDRKVRWISINEKLAHDFGFRPEDVVGKMNTDLFSPELAAKYEADDIRIMESGKTEELEEKYIREGRETWVNTIKTPVKNATGEIVGVMGLFWDITERKRMEDKLNQYTKQLEQKTRDLEQIIYVTSHDLRSPLVNIQGFAKELGGSIIELMQSVGPDNISEEALRKIGPILKKDIPESIEYIELSIAQMDRQLSALLKLSRLGRAGIAMEKLDMNRIVADLVNSLEYIIKEKEARVTVDDLPPCMADPAQTNQIVLNLIENALKYLDEKKPGTIRISATKRESNVIYCVEDNGVGIPPECREKIFEIFYRVEQRKCPGEGLGLTIVRQSAEKQHGTVWVESELGKGSKFFVKLPGI